MAKKGNFVYVRYRDHVLYHRGSPEAMMPQIREAVGWLVQECGDYIIICWDRDASPPTLKGGDPKASGLVVLRSAILETKPIGPAKQETESNGTLSHVFSKSEQQRNEEKP
jgi:hypothetical protein